MGATGNQPGQGAGGVISKVLIALALFAVGVALLAITAFYIFPLSIAGDRVQESFRQQGALVSWQSLGRTFPFGLKASGVEVSDISTGRPVVRLEEARVSLSLPGLLAGRLRFPINVRMGRGVITGVADVGAKAALLDMAAIGVEIDAIPAVSASGVRTKGTVSGALSVRFPYSGCPAGMVRLRSGRAGGDGVSFMGMPLPLGDIEQAGLNATLGNCKVVVEGMWVDASELSAKLAGELALVTPLAMTRLDMTLEVTPRGDIASKQWFLSFISQYRRSSNYYFMTIRGTIARPVLGR